MSMNLSASTQKQYSASWNDFTRWCEERDFKSLPSNLSTVTHFLIDRSKHLSEATLRKRLTAIEHFHLVHNKRSPIEDESVNGLLEDVYNLAALTDRATNDLAAVLSADERRLLDSCEGQARIDLRDRLLITLLIAFDMTRSLAHSLAVGDLRVEGDYLLLHPALDSGRRIEGNRVFSSECKYDPVRSFEAWVNEAGIESGPLFRSVDRHSNVGSGMSEIGIYKAVRKRAADAGLQNISPMMLRSVPAK